MSNCVIEALSRNDLEGAKNALLSDILAKTDTKGSWCNPHYSLDVSFQRSVKLDPSRNARFTYFGLENLQDRYLLRDADGEICEDPQTFFARVAAGLSRGELAHAQRLYDYMSRGWLLPATPVLMNAGTNKALTISCFLSQMPDTLEGIFDSYRENAFLAKFGGGIGTSFSNLRSQNMPLESSGLVSSGIVPFLKIMDSETIAISRNSVRRGAAAAYLRIDHPEIEDFIEIRKATGGDPDRRCFNLHHGIVVTDAFMQAVESKASFDLIDPHFKKIVKTVDAQLLWRKVLGLRVETGEPYLLFVDTVNKALAPTHKAMGLQVSQSNLCTEITIPTTTSRTAVCCLASLNLETYEEWKDDDTMSLLVEDSVRALDNNLETFIEQASTIGDEFRKAVNSARSDRSIGLGVMGYHGYLMSKGIPFESVMARMFNKTYFRRQALMAKAASRKLFEERGPPLDGGDQRNTYITSIQPTASTAFLCGGATPGAEPISGNAYLQKTLSGSFLVKNRYLEQRLAELGCNTEETWQKIIASKGSVQNLDALTEQDKAVFRTAYEMNMREIVEQAGDRQPFIDQSQSINLFFNAPVSGKYLDTVHKLAWKKGMKSLYYLRSEAPIQTDSIGIDSEKRNVATEECAVCQ